MLPSTISSTESSNERSNAGVPFCGKRFERSRYSSLPMIRATWPRLPRLPSSTACHSPLAEVTSDIEPWQWWLVLHRPALEHADHGLNLVLGQRDVLARYMGDVLTRMDAVGISRTFIAEILHRSVDKDLLTRFWTIEEDILGAYWIHASKIQLYWMPESSGSSVR
jgi:hypothetical protein